MGVADGLPMGWMDGLLKVLLGLLGALLAWLYRETRNDIAEMRVRMEVQERTIAVLQSTMDGRQALMLEKMEGVEKKIGDMTHLLGTMSETLIQLRIEQHDKAVRR